MTADTRIVVRYSCTHHVDELRQLELDADPEDIRGVDDRSHQLVVVGEQVVVETLGVRVAGHGAVHDQRGQQPSAERLAGTWPPLTHPALQNTTHTTVIYFLLYIVVNKPFKFIVF